MTKQVAFGLLSVALGALLMMTPAGTAKAGVGVYTSCTPNGFTGTQTCIVYACNDQGQCIEIDRYTSPILIRV